LLTSDKSRRVGAGGGGLKSVVVVVNNTISFLLFYRNKSGYQLKSNFSLNSY
jgi:hypothetical protein